MFNLSQFGDKATQNFTKLQSYQDYPSQNVRIQEYNDYKSNQASQYFAESFPRLIKNAENTL